MYCFLNFLHQEEKEMPFNMYFFFLGLNHKILNILENFFGQFFDQQTAQSYAQDSEYNGELLDNFLNRKLHSHMQKILNIMENFFGQFFEQQTAQSYAQLAAFQMGYLTIWIVDTFCNNSFEYLLQSMKLQKHVRFYICILSSFQFNTNSI